jgi:hypothetical protein
VIRRSDEELTAMARSIVSGTGFQMTSARAAPPRLIHAVAATLALAALSLCLSVAFAVLSITAASALPIAG